MRFDQTVGRLDMRPKTSNVLNWNGVGFAMMELFDPAKTIVIMNATFDLFRCLCSPNGALSKRI